LARHRELLRIRCVSMCHFSLFRKWPTRMVLRNTYLNKIRDLGYTLKTETRRVHIFRKIGGSHYIPVKKCDKLEDDFVRSTLMQAGLTAKDADAFIATYKC